MSNEQTLEKIVRLAKRKKMYAKAIEGIDVEAAIKDFNDRKQEPHGTVDKETTTEK